jgi:CBS domain-containing protein
MKARDLMTENPECVSESDPIGRAAQLMRDLNVGLLPVVDDSNSRRLTGVITDRDIAVRHVAEGHDGECRVGDEMTRDNHLTVSPDDDDRTVLTRMRDGQVRRIPVVENDRVVGIVAQADVAVEGAGSGPKDVGRTVADISEPARPDR